MAPDAFAIAAYILKHSGAYIEIVNEWPPVPYQSVEQWHKAIQRIAKQWRRLYMASQAWPKQLDAWWTTILAATTVDLQDVAAPMHRSLLQALAGVVAAADETCFCFGVLEAIRDDMDFYAMFYLVGSETLCKDIHPSRVTVLPKLHNPLNGMTLRSLTHNLALWDKPEVRAHWTSLAPPSCDSGLNILLLPWPLAVSPIAFRAASTDCNEKMPDGFGFFTYEPKSGGPADVDRIKMLLEKAEALVGPVEAVIFPELSLSDEQFERVREAFKDRVIVAGVGEAARDGKLGKNEVVVVVPGSDVPPAIYRQSKHHRWRLEAGQIEQYGLGPTLAKENWWWEAIHLPQRECTFFNANNWLTFCVLICEDLARQDPVAELVRSVGPNLVIALLMDGPQIPERWSARYATVLAEDPRCSVLSFTSAGLVDLARSQANKGPRSVGLWKDALSGQAKQVILEPGAEGIVLSLGRDMVKEWTADGRHDDQSTGYLRLTGIHQVYPDAEPKRNRTRRRTAKGSKRS